MSVGTVDRLGSWVDVTGFGFSAAVAARFAGLDGNAPNGMNEKPVVDDGTVGFFSSSPGFAL